MNSAPCVHVSGTEQRRCAASPTSLYIQGRLCCQHTPHALAGEPEPSPTAVAATARRRGDTARPYTWQAVMFIHEWNLAARRRAERKG